MLLFCRYPALSFLLNTFRALMCAVYLLFLTAASQAVGCLLYPFPSDGHLVAGASLPLTICCHKDFLRCFLTGLWENFFGWLYIRNRIIESWRAFTHNLTKSAKFLSVNICDFNVDGDVVLATQNPDFSAQQEVVSYLR